LGWAVIYARRESDALAPAMRLRARNRSVALYLFLVYLATAALAALLMRRQTHLFAANQSLIQELEKQSKFKDQFLSTMSHELRTPLNAILGFSDLLGDPRYGPLNEKQRRYIDHIHTGGKHLLTLISDILDLSKIEAGRMELATENLAVQPTFAEVISVMQPLADTSKDASLRLFTGFGNPARKAKGQGWAWPSHSALWNCMGLSCVLRVRQGKEAVSISIFQRLPLFGKRPLARQTLQRDP
jgi:signal transduction histidine kinase